MFSYQGTSNRERFFLIHDITEGISRGGVEKFGGEWAEGGFWRRDNGFG